MAKIPFASAYDLHKEVQYSKSGKRIRNIYNYKVDNRGNKILVKTGEEDLQDLINSYEEETKIENIMARAKLGDPTALRHDIDFADLTKIPSNLIEAKKQIQEMDNYWMSLPAEIRGKYGNNINKFLDDVGTENWIRNMGLDHKETTVVNNSKKEAASSEAETSV